MGGGVPAERTRLSTYADGAGAAPVAHRRWQWTDRARSRGDGPVDRDVAPSPGRCLSSPGGVGWNSSTQFAERRPNSGHRLRDVNQASHPAAGVGRFYFVLCVRSLEHNRTNRPSMPPLFRLDLGWIAWSSTSSRARSLTRCGSIAGEGGRRGETRPRLARPPHSRRATPDPRRTTRDRTT